MGIRGSFAEISAEEFNRTVAGLRPKFQCLQWHSVDKEWHGFHRVFRDKTPPLNLSIVGDWLHPESSHTLDEFCKGNHEGYCGYVSPQTVQAVGASLDDLSMIELQNWYAACNLAFGDYELHMFQEMKTAYHEAAERGNALLIVIR